jgi:hypothetical protein
MAKRKTIRINPLDTVAPDPMTHQIGESPAVVKARSIDPASVIAQTPTSPTQSKIKASHPPAPAAQVAQPPAPTDLSTRIQSLEKQNTYLMWLVGGGILLAVLL